MTVARWTVTDDGTSANADSTVGRALPDSQVSCCG